MSLNSQLSTEILLSRPDLALMERGIVCVSKVGVTILSMPEDTSQHQKSALMPYTKAAHLKPLGYPDWTVLTNQSQKPMGRGEADFWDRSQPFERDPSWAISTFRGAN